MSSKSALRFGVPSFADKKRLGARRPLLEKNAPFEVHIFRSEKTPSLREARYNKCLYLTADSGEGHRRHCQRMVDTFRTGLFQGYKMIDVKKPRRIYDTSQERTVGKLLDSYMTFLLCFRTSCLPEPSSRIPLLFKDRRPKYPTISTSQQHAL